MRDFRSISTITRARLSGRLIALGAIASFIAFTIAPTPPARAQSLGLNVIFDENVSTGGFGTFTGDFDGDGALDVALPAPSSLELFRGDGAGGFAALPLQSVPYGFGGGDGGAEGDFNEDGRTDLVHIVGGARLLLGNASGVFTVSGVFQGPTVSGARAADFDGDGHLDVVTWLTSTVNFHRGLGDGTFAPPIDSPGLLLGSARMVGDLNGDGLLDLLISTTGSVEVAFGTPAGTFVPAWSGLFQVGSLADFDGDGDLDLLSTSPMRIATNPGTGTGFLLGPILGTVANPPGLAEPADFDNDGQIDVATIATDLRIWLGDGAGGLTLDAQATGIHFDLPPPIDLDNDGWLEIVTPRTIAHTLRLTIRSAAPAFRRADVNLDGIVDLGDAIYGLGSLFGSGSPATCLDASDSNDDGVVDIADMIHIMNYLFSGGPTPSAPGPDECGSDPTVDGLDCAQGPCS